MKVKLRDLTKEQYKKWKNSNCLKTDRKKCIFRFLDCLNIYDTSWCNYKKYLNDDFLSKEIEIEEMVNQ